MTGPRAHLRRGELVSESIAYTCCWSVGIATDENSIPYLAGRAELVVLEQTAKLIDRLVAPIEVALDSDWQLQDGCPRGSLARWTVCQPLGCS